MGRKLGMGSAPLFREGSGVPSNTVAWAEADLHAKWHLDPSNHLATTDMGGRLGALLLWGGGAEYPSSNVARAEAYLITMFHRDPSNRLAVWPQYTNVTDRTDRQTDRSAVGKNRTVCPTPSPIRQSESQQKTSCTVHCGALQSVTIIWKKICITKRL